MTKKAKKTSITIKKEKFRGKYYMVARDDGQLIDRRKFEKGFTEKQAEKIFKKNKMLHEKITRERLTSPRWARKRGFYIDEISDFETKELNPRYKEYQYVIVGRLRTGKEVFGRSDKYGVEVPVEEAIKEARRRFFSNLSSVFSEDIYDEDKGIGLAVQLKEDDGISIKEGFVYYAKFQTSKTDEAEA